MLQELFDGLEVVGCRLSIVECAMVSVDSMVSAAFVVDSSMDRSSIRETRNHPPLNLPRSTTMNTARHMHRYTHRLTDTRGHHAAAV